MKATLKLQQRKNAWKQHIVNNATHKKTQTHLACVPHLSSMQRNIEIIGWDIGHAECHDIAMKIRRNALWNIEIFNNAKANY